MLLVAITFCDFVIRIYFISNNSHRKSVNIEFRFKTFQTIKSFFSHTHTRMHAHTHININLNFIICVGTAEMV